jgi:hypothetical protein
MKKSPCKILFLTILACGLGVAIRAQDVTAAQKPEAVTKAPVANPLYAAWKGQEGKTVVFNRTGSMSGGICHHSHSSDKEIFSA